MFRSWPAELPWHVEVRALALPGRGERIADPAVDKLGELVGTLADAAEPLVDRSWALFGHSMGAILAFELARELRRRGLPDPRLLAVAGQDAPHTAGSGSELHRLPDAELVDELRRLDGTPAEVLESADVLGLILPALRADFRIGETYGFEAQAPLDVPILVLDGLGDPETSEQGIEGWAQHSSARTDLVRLPGRHFFLHAAQTPLLQALGRALDRAGPPPDHRAVASRAGR